MNDIEEIIRGTGIKLAQAGLGLQYVPDDNELLRCHAFGKEFAGKVKGG